MKANGLHVMDKYLLIAICYFVEGDQIIIINPENEIYIALMAASILYIFYTDIGRSISKKHLL